MIIDHGPICKGQRIEKNLIFIYVAEITKRLWAILYYFTL